MLSLQEVQNEAADHDIHLVGNLQLDKMTRTDDLAAHQLRAPLGETVHVSAWTQGRGSALGNRRARVSGEYAFESSR